jgi:hypothetical protein
VGKSEGSVKVVKIVSSVPIVLMGVLKEKENVGVGKEMVKGRENVGRGSRQIHLPLSGRGKQSTGQITGRPRRDS